MSNAREILVVLNRKPLQGGTPPQMGCISPWKTLLKPGQVFGRAGDAEESRKHSTVTSVFVSDAKTPVRKNLVLTPIFTLSVNPHGRPFSTVHNCHKTYGCSVLLLYI